MLLEFRSSPCVYPRNMRFAFEKLPPEINDSLMAIDEFYVPPTLSHRPRAPTPRRDDIPTIVAMTGSYFRGDSVRCSTGRRSKFTGCFQHYDQLNGPHLSQAPEGDRPPLLPGPLHRCDPRSAGPRQKTIVHI